VGGDGMWRTRKMRPGEEVGGSWGKMNKGSSGELRSWERFFCGGEAGLGGKSKSRSIERYCYKCRQEKE
jgi:hypothetical protein